MSCQIPLPLALLIIGTDEIMDPYELSSCFLPLIFWFLASIPLFLCVLCLEESSPWILGVLDSLLWFIRIYPSAKPSGINSSHEFEFFTFLRKPQYTLISSRILKSLWSFGRDLLGIYSRNSCEGILQVWLDLDFLCSRFIIWILVLGGFLGTTGQTGRQKRSVR